MNRDLIPFISKSSVAIDCVLGVTYYGLLLAENVVVFCNKLSWFVSELLEKDRSNVVVLFPILASFRLLHGRLR